MGWVWKDEEDDNDQGEISSRSEERCSTRRMVSTQCRTEEVEPGKFIKKCEKTEQILKDCVGRPSEVVQSNKEYTEEDVTDQIKNGGSLSSEVAPFDFPGLRSDIDAIERNLFGNMNRFFEAAEEMKNGFFNIFGSPHLYDGESESTFGSLSPPPPPRRPSKRDVPIESSPSKAAKPDTQDGHVDLSGLARDV
ncbi:hypothetical protein CTI12_AA311760 [Artemisia annua]|uniref:Mal d 1-associated protein n=1 Tax=Artemisia annua TaxID=35608 RepID=A0A2U1MQD8_ARTAN|nr:hypothetical protein CTI12_AA311760 [Artemisia annua]